MTDTTEKSGATDDTPATDIAAGNDTDTDTPAADTDTETDTDTGPDSDTDADTAPDSRVLEELDEHIRAARAAAEETLGDPEHTFVESGDAQSESLDDQTIAPG